MADMRQMLIWAMVVSLALSVVSLVAVGVLSTEVARPPDGYVLLTDGHRWAYRDPTGEVHEPYGSGSWWSRREALHEARDDSVLRPRLLVDGWIGTVNSNRTFVQQN